MSNKIKRIPKTKEQLVEKVIDNQIENFKTALKEIEDKYGFKLEPAMYYSKMGAFPQIEIRKTEKETTKPEESVV